MNAYEVLGLPWNAIEQQIRDARKAFAKKWHPDLCSLPLAGEMMARVNDAADTRLDPEKRRALDARLVAVGIAAPKRRVTRRKPAKHGKRRTAKPAAAVPPPPPEPQQPSGLFVNIAGLYARDLPLGTGLLWMFVGALADREFVTEHVKPPPRG
jgi:curved DNA-binding protein CbpA